MAVIACRETRAKADGRRRGVIRRVTPAARYTVWDIGLRSWLKSRGGPVL